jgi:hypothetical protein
MVKTASKVSKKIRFTKEEKESFDKLVKDISEIIERSGVKLKKGMNPKSKSEARRMVEQSRENLRD